jgi:hypothetical protein
VSRPSDHRASASRPFAEQVLLALNAIVSVVGLVPLGLAFLFMGLQCDESCEGASWGVGAWQWSAQFWLAALAYVLTAGALYVTLKRRPSAVPAAARALACWLGWITFMFIA